MRRNAIITAIFLTVALSFAHGESSNGAKKGYLKAQKTCLRFYSSSDIDPIRDVVIFPGGSIKTPPPILENDRVPTASEVVALKALFIAALSCDNAYFNSLKDSAKKRGPDLQRVFESADRRDLGLLISGDITIAEFNQQKIEEGEAAERALKFDVDSKDWFEEKIGKWLDPEKTKYTSESPWWVFYNYALSTAKEVDANNVLPGVADVLIERKRIEVNRELVAAATPKPLTLNCSVNGPNGAEIQIPVVVDYAGLSVNGWPAKFFPNSINWDVKNTAGVYHWNLNRLSGYLSIGTDEVPFVSGGMCSAAKPKF